jgi:hypothetical protein
MPKRVPSIIILGTGCKKGYRKTDDTGVGQGAVHCFIGKLSKFLELGKYPFFINSPDI